MFKIIADTREQCPFEFPVDSEIKDIIVRKVDTGDYTIEGLEDVLCIERKRNASELAKNVIDKRFDRELERMKDFKYKFIIIEESWGKLSDYPYNLKPSIKRRILKYKRYVKGSLIVSKLLSYALNYDIHIITCNGPKEGAEIALKIMKKIYAKER